MMTSSEFEVGDWPVCSSVEQAIRTMTDDGDGHIGQMPDLRSEGVWSCHDRRRPLLPRVTPTEDGGDAYPARSGGGGRPEPEESGGREHALVVGDDMAEVPTELLCGGEMDGIE